MLFEFFSPVKIVAGDNAIFSLAVHMKNLKIQHPIIITDRGIIKSSILKFPLKALKEGKINNFTIYDDIPPETSKSSIYAAKRLYLTSGCDGIIAVGGGSVIDSAKALAFLIGCKKDSLEQIEGANFFNCARPPFIVIPTTSGTGSELTKVAVILDETKNRKIALADENLMPDVAILDPVMTLTMPEKLTAITGIDALSHAIEAYISTASNPISKALSIKAILMIFNNLEDSIKKKNIQTRFNMAVASTVAGMAFSNAMVGINHSLAHAAGGLLHIPHGIAVGVFMVESLKAMQESISSELEELYDYTIKKKITANKASAFIKEIEDFMERVSNASGVSFKLKDYLKNPALIDEIAKNALLDGSSIFSKIEFTKSKAIHIIKNALER